MAAWPTYVAADLAEYSGRPVASYTVYATQALKQALLLFKLGTCLTEWPDDPTDAELAEYGLLSMADALILAQPHQVVLANPFQSESIGSYSYSLSAKMAAKIQLGEETGVGWFDKALQHLGVCGTDSPHGSVESGSLGVFEWDQLRGTLTSGPDEGKSTVLGPADMDAEEGFGGVFSPDTRGGKTTGYQL